MKILSDIRGPVSFTTYRPWNPASANVLTAEHWQEHARNPAGLGSVTGAPAVECVPFSTRQSAAG